MIPTTSRVEWWVRDFVRGFDDSIDLADPGHAVINFGERLYQEQGEDRRSRADAALFFYHGNSRQSLRGSRLMLGAMVFNEDPPFRNVIQSCTDTKTAHIFREQVRCFALTSRGDADLIEKAKGITQAIEGAFETAGLYGQKGNQVCQDGHLFEAGGVKLTPDIANNRVLCDRVFSWEVFVPEEEARSGNPRQMVHRQVADRQTLIEMFPDHAELIRMAPCAPDDWRFAGAALSGDTSDLVAVWEAWHLPSCRVDLDDEAAWGLKDGKPDASVDPKHDGRHVIAIGGPENQGGVLLDQPWPFEFFPFAWYKPSPDPVGYWSRSIPESLAGVQLELIKLGRRIQALIHFLAIPRLIVWRNAKINKNTLATNDYLSIIESSQVPSQSVWQAAFPSVPSELFQREDALVEWAMRQVGISELSAFAQRPAGIDHAPGLQHLADTESIRHTPSFRAWREFHLTCGRIHIEMFRLLAKHNKDFEIVFGDSKDLKRIKWADVDMGRNLFELRLHPTNFLPTTPGAKASRIVQYVQSGVFTPSQGLAAAIEYPDIERLVGNESAAIRNVAKKLASVVLDGLNETNAPHGYMDLGECKRQSKELINALEADGEKQSKIEGVRDFWQMAHNLELKLIADQKAAEATQVSFGAGGAAPPQPAAA